MEEYSLYFGIICLILAAYTLIKGVTGAVRQSQDPGSASIIPPPALGVVASILLTYGLGFLKIKFPWWGFRAIFPGTTLLFPAIIYLIGRRPSSK